MSPTHLRLR